MSYILGDVGAFCFEEPVNDRNLAELARVAAASPVPLAYGEHSFTIHDFRELITRQIARILTPDATICGGISTSLEVGKLAHTFGHHVEPHCGGLTAVGMAANLHVAAAMPSIDIFEFDSREEQPLRDELPTEPIFALDRIVDGRMPVPTGPGLGIEVDEAVFEKYPYRLDKDVARSFATYATPHI
jgi:D-galactarolactone cycloisomerase